MDFNNLDEVKIYIDNKIKDRRPTKIDADEMQSALLGISKFITAGVSTVAVDNDTITGNGSVENPLIADQKYLQAEIEARELLELSLENKADLVDGTVPAAQLPSYVDDVIEGNYIDSTHFEEEIEGVFVPVIPEKGKIYLDLETNSQYRCGGTVYIQITASPGTTDNVPEGATNKYFTASRVLLSVLTGLGFSDATAIKATDNIIAALGKLQAQINGFPVAAKALFSDINAGTDDDKFATSLALEDSKYLTQDGSKVYSVTTGTNTYLATVTPAITELKAGQHFYLKNGNNNTGACTLNINGTGAKPLYKYVNTPLSAGDLPKDKFYIVCYTGTAYQIVGIDVSLPSVDSGERALTVTTNGIQKDYEVVQSFAADLAALSSASWSNDKCTGVTGYQGQVTSDAQYVYICTHDAGWWDRFKKGFPTVTAGEIVLTVTPAGVQKNYDVMEAVVVSVTDLQSATWINDTCSGISGFITQMAFDVNYIYYCFDSTGKWGRIPRGIVAIEIRLPDVDDSGGIKSNAQMEVLYPNAQIGQEVKSANRIYTKEAAAQWIWKSYTKCL